MSDRKIINDPVFGFINIPKGLLYDIVCHPLLQRLTRIKQLGLSSAVYPGAQHTRFQHSLGAFHLMSETIKHLTAKGNFIFDSEAEAVQAAILLHDIGHGPFSHVLENTLAGGVSHEEISLMLMLVHSFHQHQGDVFVGDALHDGIFQYVGEGSVADVVHQDSGFHSFGFAVEDKVSFGGKLLDGLTH